MDISINGEMALSKVITSRLNADNIDRLASIISSNCCEKYFGILVKYSQGKRLNLDKQIVGEFYNSLLPVYVVVLILQVMCMISLV